MIEPLLNAARAAAESGLPSPPTTSNREAELDSGRLFGRTRRLVINHQGERYCLQVTRAGKLLLTK